MMPGVGLLLLALTLLLLTQNRQDRDEPLSGVGWLRFIAFGLLLAAALLLMLQTLVWGVRFFL